MRWRKQTIRAFAIALLSTAPAAAQPGDPDAGETVFGACKACHQVGAGARNGIGPHLDALFGRRAGSLAGFKYSNAMKTHGADGLVWNAETLDRYIADPPAMIPGTRMSYRGLADATQRNDLIAFLKIATTASPAPDPSAAASPRQEIGAAAMALAGDPAYGEYLASECVTCHQASGHADGIPSIVGWPKDAFIRALFEYKTNVRRHEVMKLMTTNLGNEEIASLAAYFGKLVPQ